MPAAAIAILGSDAEAPLKLTIDHVLPCELGGDPRQRCRGPVEAHSARARASTCGPDPRQRCRGPVEAPRAARLPAPHVGSILGSDAEAPLKQSVLRALVLQEGAILGSDAEAPLKLHRGVTDERAPHPILGSDAEAPLKPGGARRGDRRLASILGSDAEAPLKPAHEQRVGLPARPILGSDAEAPLKRVRRPRPRRSHCTDPRQRCRGPVEARRRRRRRSVHGVRSSAAMPRPR